MASHIELKPDDHEVPLILAGNALDLALRAGTVINGGISVDNTDGTRTLIGGTAGNIAQWVGDTIPPSKPTGLSASCTDGIVTVEWNGKLTEPTPADFAYCSLETDTGNGWYETARYTHAGSVALAGFDSGAVIDLRLIAFDNAHAEDGTLARNASEPSDIVTIAVDEAVTAADWAEGAERLAQAETQMAENAKAAQAASDKADRLVSQISDVTTTINGQESKLKELDANIQGVASDGQATAKSVTEVKQTVDSISASVSQASRTASDALSKANTAQATADGFGRTLSTDYMTGASIKATYATQSSLNQTSQSLSSSINGVSSVASAAKTAAGKAQSTADTAVSKSSQLAQDLDGFRTTVLASYGQGGNLWPNPLFDPSKPMLGTLATGVSAPNGGNVVKLTGRSTFAPNSTAFPVSPGQVIQVTADCKHTTGSLPLHASVWYTKRTSGEAYDGYGNEPVSDVKINDDGWHTLTWRFRVPAGKSMGVAYMQIEQWDGKMTDTWLVSNLVYRDITGVQTAGDYATRSEVKQTADSISASVGKTYVKQSTAAAYATKSEVTSQVKQLSDSVTATFATKTTVQNVSAKADKAQSTADTATGGVNEIRAYIRQDSNGITVGKQNGQGAYTTPRARVGSDGSFSVQTPGGRDIIKAGSDNNNDTQVTANGNLIISASDGITLMGGGELKLNDGIKKVTVGGLPIPPQQHGYWKGSTDDNGMTRIVVNLPEFATTVERQAIIQLTPVLTDETTLKWMDPVVWGRGTSDFTVRLFNRITGNWANAQPYAFFWSIFWNSN